MADNDRSSLACPRCGDSRETIESSGRFFYKNGYCNQCGAEYYRQRRTNPEIHPRLLEQKRAFNARNREKNAAAARLAQRRLKLELLARYGTECACCGEGHIEFLSIDHINGDGAEHRKAIGGAYRFYGWLKKNGFPEGFRTLCMNCNMALGFFGYCPHGNVTVGSAKSNSDLQ